MSANLQLQKLFAVDGLIAVITGAGSGIGLIMAKALSENGAAAIYLLGRHPDSIEKAAKTIVSKSSLPQTQSTQSRRPIPTPSSVM
jgi:NADP-dependent 3-hydroxy acid dehydrogenase YdfG